MSDPTTNESVATEAPAVSEAAAPVAAKKKAVKKAAKKPAAAKGKKAAKKATTVVKKDSSGPSIRERVFKLLAKNEEGQTGSQIAEKLALKGIPMLLKDEGVCDKPRIKRLKIEGARGIGYALTALGKKHTDEGKVDECAAPGSSGKEW